MHSLRLALLSALVASIPAQVPPTPAPTTAPAPQSGTSLVYDLPAYDLGRLLDATKGATIDSVVADVVAKVQVRIGDRATVTPLGGTAFAVEVLGDAARVAEVRSIVETRSLEMRAVATSDYRSDGVAFDLPEECKRLEQWLADGGRDLVLADPRQIERFNGDAKRGPLAAPHLRWVPHFVERSAEDARAWQTPLVVLGGSGTPSLKDSTVAVFDLDRDFNRGAVPAHQQENTRLLEFVAINWHELSFGGADLDPSSIFAEGGWDRDPGIRYRLRNERAGLYADWSQKYIGKHTAVLVDGRVRAAPYFLTRVSGGAGIIAGSFTDAEIDGLAAMLRRGDLPLTPTLLRQEPLGTKK